MNVVQWSLRTLISSSIPYLSDSISEQTSILRLYLFLHAKLILWSLKLLNVLLADPKNVIFTVHRTMTDMERFQDVRINATDATDPDIQKEPTWKRFKV
jgi:hypothetical protein